MAKQLKLAGALGHAAADKRVEILRGVGACGSISQAAREAGVSYKAAWQALDTLSNLAGTALVERVVGGSGGGGALLTAAGMRLLDAATELGRARTYALARIAGGDVPEGLASLGLRTSMRNQLPCVVDSLHTEAGAMRVRLALQGGATLDARITRESAQLLGLARGLPVLALCKATAIAIVVSARAGAGRNLLRGNVVRSTRAASGGEVALELPGGLRLVGFASAPLAVGSAATGVLADSAVAIALPG